MSQNSAARSPEERAEVNADLAASGVAYRERLNLPVIPSEAERQQPEELREYFRERLQYYRNLALQYPRGTDPVYIRKNQRGNESKRPCGIFRDASACSARRQGAGAPPRRTLRGRPPCACLRGQESRKGYSTPSRRTAWRLNRYSHSCRRLSGAIPKIFCRCLL